MQSIGWIGWYGVRQPSETWMKVCNVLALKEMEFSFYFTTFFSIPIVNSWMDRDKEREDYEEIILDVNPTQSQILTNIKKSNFAIQF